MLSRVNSVAARVQQACVESGRNHSDVTIVAVTKKQPSEKIEKLLSLGFCDFGENYVQEWQTKKSLHPSAQWHFIGRLQRNKVKFVAGHVKLIHSVDSVLLAQSIAKRCETSGLQQEILLTVNAAGEESKSGFLPEQIKDVTRELSLLKNISCVGLMTMPPLTDEPETSRSYFKLLRDLRDQLLLNFPKMVHLSMGTSGDFEVAIQEGATMIRLGTTLVGPRLE